MLHGPPDAFDGFFVFLALNQIGKRIYSKKEKNFRNI
nr:MAG TPA: hypothetical protein [Caudoviricetes sp.]